MSVIDLDFFLSLDFDQIPLCSRLWTTPEFLTEENLELIPIYYDEFEELDYPLKELEDRMIELTRGNLYQLRGVTYKLILEFRPSFSRKKCAFLGKLEAL